MGKINLTRGNIMFSKKIICLTLVMSSVLTSLSATAADAPPYTVTDGYKVDAATMTGFRVWREANCAACHGADQQGQVGPSLIDSLKVLSKAEFVNTVTNGRLAQGMPAWNTNKRVMDNIDSLYAYLKGRSDGAITRTKPELMQQQ
jgi:mono/diheme cytochrome c family protein